MVVRSLPRLGQTDDEPGFREKRGPGYFAVKVSQILLPLRCAAPSYWDNSIQVNAYIEKTL